MALTGTGGEVANALVCKTSIHGFNSHPVLQIFLLRILSFSLLSLRNQCKFFISTEARVL